jgi:hypothetical protein
MFDGKLKLVGQYPDGRIFFKVVVPADDEVKFESMVAAARKKIFGKTTGKLISDEDWF